MSYTAPPMGDIPRFVLIVTPPPDEPRHRARGVFQNDTTRHNYILPERQFQMGKPVPCLPRLPLRTLEDARDSVRARRARADASSIASFGRLDLPTKGNRTQKHDRGYRMAPIPYEKTTRKLVQRNGLDMGQEKAEESEHKEKENQVPSIHHHRYNMPLSAHDTASALGAIGRIYRVAFGEERARARIEDNWLASEGGAALCACQVPERPEKKWHAEAETAVALTSAISSDKRTGVRRYSSRGSRVEIFTDSSATICQEPPKPEAGGDEAPAGAGWWTSGVSQASRLAAQNKKYTPPTKFDHRIKAIYPPSASDEATEGMGIFPPRVRSRKGWGRGMASLDNVLLLATNNESNENAASYHAQRATLNSSILPVGKKSGGAMGHSEAGGDRMCPAAGKQEKNSCGAYEAPCPKAPGRLEGQDLCVNRFDRKEVDTNRPKGEDTNTLETGTPGMVNTNSPAPTNCDMLGTITPASITIRQSPELQEVDHSPAPSGMTEAQQRGQTIPILSKTKRGVASAIDTSADVQDSRTTSENMTYGHRPAGNSRMDNPYKTPKASEGVRSKISLMRGKVNGILSNLSWPWYTKKATMQSGRILDHQTTGKESKTNPLLGNPHATNTPPKARTALFSWKWPSASEASTPF